MCSAVVLTDFTAGLMVQMSDLENEVAEGEHEGEDEEEGDFHIIQKAGPIKETGSAKEAGSDVSTKGEVADVSSNSRGGQANGTGGADGAPTAGESTKAHL